MSQPLPFNPALSASVLPRRFIALFIDAFVICVTGLVAALFIGIFGVFTLGIGWLAFHIIPLLPFAYYTLLVGGTGATPGRVWWCARMPMSPPPTSPRRWSGACCSTSVSSSPASRSWSFFSIRATAPRMTSCPD